MMTRRILWPCLVATLAATASSQQFESPFRVQADGAAIDVDVGQKPVARPG